MRFGGQLVVNGAAGSDEVSKSPLADLLPLTPTSNIELDPDAAATMLKKWQVKSDRSTTAKIESLREQVNRIAVDGQLAIGASAVKDTGNLIVEKRFGRGRVVQPRFDLTEDWLQDWDSYDSFVNSVILLRPRRKTIESFTQDTEMRYAQEYVDYGIRDSDAILNTHFRISARDAVLGTTNDGSSLAAKQVNPIDKYFFSHPVTGVSSWSDESDAIRSCRDILKSESGIEIPNSSLVIRSLGYYLLALVPINYLIFRLLGRLEYAWLAVPVIALVGAMWVARAARLDIGFARSQTEIALLEVQPDYERAHLSRVVAIYNSLSDRYAFDFKTYDGAAVPIRDGSNKDTDDDYLFQTDYNEGPRLDNFTVGSNRIRMLHAEQIVDLGGTIGLAGGKVTNNTTYDLYDTFVIKKSLENVVEIANVGILSPGTSLEPKFESLDTVAVSDEIPMQSARLLRKVASPIVMPPGTARLVGRIDSSMPGMTVTPSTSQTSGQTIVLAHLQHAPLLDPKPDVNLITDLRSVITDKNQKGDDEPAP